MAVKIRLKRLGKIRAPYYRIVVADSRTKRDGRVIEEIGKYHPTENPSFIEVDSDRAQYWLSVGAQPSLTVLSFLRQEQVSGLIRSRPKRKNRKKPASVRKRRAAKAAARETTKKKAKGKPKAAKES